MQRLLKYKNASYLRRLILTVFLALCIPCTLMGFFLCRQGYDRMRMSNSETHMRVSRQYAGYVDEYLSRLVTHALQIGLDQKLSQKQIEQNPYYVIEASQTLAAYLLGASASDIGVRFEGADYIITSQYKYSVSDFCEKYAANEGQRARMIDFFARRATALFSCFSTFSGAGDGKIIMTVPLHAVGSRIRGADILYILDNEALSGPIFGFADNAGVIIMSGEELLYATNGLSALAGQLEGGARRARLGDTAYELFWTDSAFRGLRFAMAVPAFSAFAEAAALYKAMMLTLGVCALLLATLFAAAIYTNYLPVRQLIRRVSGADGAAMRGHEFQYIETAFEQLHNQRESLTALVEEQRMILEEHALLETMLSGAAADESALPPLREGECVRAACVFGAKLTGTARNRCAETVKERFGARLYVLDPARDAHKALAILFPNPGQAREIEEVIRGLFEALGLQAFFGGVKGSFSELSASYEEAYMAMCEKAFSSQYESLSHLSGGDAHPPLTDEAVRFLKAALSGQTEEAQARLDSYIASVKDSCADNMAQMYWAHLLLSQYLRDAERLDCHPDGVAALRLVCARTADEFARAMKPELERVGAEVLLRARESEGRYRRELMRYVDENCFTAEITLLSVADHFDISIYTLSRLFKEITGVGFKEYVTARRIEQAKYLLATTDDSIREIALGVGLSGPDYFTRLFKAHYGLTPSAFRENDGAKENPQ